MEWNNVIYADCMNEDNGLSTLPDKSIDLGITDIPFNININSKRIGIGGSTTISKKKEFYSDNKKNYKEWCEEWFIQLERICKSIIIYCGLANLSMWCNIKKPKGFAILNVPNSNSRGYISHYMHLRPILFYGEIKKKLKTDYYEYIAYNGFLRKKTKLSLIHPCPLNTEFWYDLIKQLKPTSVIDPFLGSGTTAEVCTKLGIKWLGYELNEVYSQDINKRLKNCKKEPKQINLEIYNSD